MFSTLRVVYSVDPSENTVKITPLHHWMSQSEPTSTCSRKTLYVLILGHSYDGDTPFKKAGGTTRPRYRGPTSKDAIPGLQRRAGARGRPGSDRTQHRKQGVGAAPDSLHLTSSSPSSSKSLAAPTSPIAATSVLGPTTLIMEAVSAGADGIVRTLAFEDYAPCAVVQPLITGTGTESGPDTTTGVNNNATANSLQVTTRITTSFPQS